MTALLTDNLPLLAGAPNGIKKLRELILELAVRGKLVPQDTNDEPASELLKRIAEEKARSVAAGKKVKQQADINDKEQPFSVPQGWSWVRLGSCLEMINGRAFKPTEWIGAGLPIVRIQNLNKPDAPFNYCDPDTVDDRHIIDTGTILISWSGTPGTSFGAFIWERGRAALNQHIFSCSQVGDAFFDKFLKLAINTRLEELIAKAHGGVGLQHVTKGKLEALTLVLPPLAEQRRIVAKVDELMALCDRLEARQADADSAHAQLVQALLDSLTQARDAEDFAQSWQRLAEHFHTLFTTESSIDALKQTLLQLAVMGKLVPQAPSDEPASELLKRIAEEKARLMAGGQIKKQKKLLKDIGSADQKFELPPGWEAARLSDVVNILNGRAYKKEELLDVGTPVLRVGNLFTSNHWYYSNLTLEEDKYCNPGDLLFAWSASFGPFIWQGERSIYHYHIWKLDFYAQDQFSKNYLYNFLLEQTQEIKAAGHGVSMVHMTKEKMEKLVVPVPPLAEQHRIVAKVDQLMALCDQLKARLNQSRQVHEQLANALVEQAVA
ncbi:TPA: restriction endonuclease subunit S [Pseudomonas aeruginosa]|uniref:restriction endonuclease subunit S n=1 Tax=Pseudomonas aeruginosa TaxID=287 RepID=UPI00093686FC|nr:restriction endonuclease subunit S [Pseudomonas aeruginosa]EIU5250883.1 restriction endonuclease subunit S [Pseudomonas aeruginosa]MBG6347441.1 restriction endonuclease subunit S [Pseudomonas aeruginosa]MBG6546194.1 restriction endonuclease subunit S [Pseudomonas aeruginosa]MBH3501091.1 restriction endonuclease subunit S [Pseudomonas aeruginosa]MBH4420173.1 restriction endonuclease subunit S [Pseudomonas aeruginosa]